MRAILLCLLLAGCASGVHMTDDEARACRDAATGCSVWTDAELEALAQRIGDEGYRMGWRDAIRQHDKDL